MAIGVPIAAAVIGAGATVYSVNAQQQTERRAERNADQLAAKAQAEANHVDDPNMVSAASQMQANERRAASAGGTITGQSNAQIGDAANSPKKSLLGS